VLCLVVSCCCVTSCKMKCSAGNSDSAGGEGLVVKIKMMTGDVESASDLDGEKEDHETSNLKDVLRKKLQEMQRKKSNKIRRLGSTGRLTLETLSHRLSCGHFTSHFKALSTRRLLTSYSICRSYACGAITPSDKQNYDHQTGPFHAVRIVTYVNSCAPA